MNLANYNSTVLLIISVLACSISTLSDGFFFKKNKVNKKSTYLFNSFYFLLTAFLIFALSGFKIKMSVYTLLLGLAFGASTTLTALLGVFAIKKGPYGFTRVIINLSTAVTALSGYFFFNEDLNFFKIIGIILMLVCFFLAINLKDKDGKKGNIVWLILSIGAMIACASIGLEQKVHQSSVYKDELNQFLVIAFIFSALVTFIISFIVKNEENSAKVDKRIIKFAVIYIILKGVFVTINNVFNLYLSGVIDSSIFFPIANGVPLLIDVLMSFIIFKEKLSLKQIIGLGIGLLSIICFIL